jgi:DNA-binding LytR/AlgR family response regulator
MTASPQLPAPGPYAVDVAIVGGGIAGLAAAYELSRRGVSFVVLERAPRAGGVIFSEAIDGFTIDGGPDALLIQKPEAIALCREIGLGDRLVSTKPPRIAYIQRGGRLHALPAASVLGIPTRIGPFVRTTLFSWAGKIRMGAELFVPRKRDDADESIGAFMTRRFGTEAATYLAEPLLAGIHAGDVDRLSVRALFPRLVDAERTHGSLLRAFAIKNPVPNPIRNPQSAIRNVMLRVYLVDDERLAVERLTRLLTATGRVTIVGSSTDPEAALEFLRGHPVDALFLDIQMPGLTGFELLEQLETEAAVVFTTAYDRYAIEAFGVNSVDYLLKPIEPERLDKALDKLARFAGQPRPDMRALARELAAALAPNRRLERIASRVGERTKVLEVATIGHFTSKDKLTFAVVNGHEHVIDHTLAELEARLDPRRFARIHRWSG